MLLWEEYGKIKDIRTLSRAPEHTRNCGKKQKLLPRAVDREIATALHMTHMGNTSKPEALVRQASP